MACCSHIPEGLPDHICPDCMYPMQVKKIKEEPGGKYFMSVKGILVPFPTGMTHSDIRKMASFIVDKHTYLVFPNGVKVHPSAL